MATPMHMHTVPNKVLSIREITPMSIRKNTPMFLMFIRRTSKEWFSLTLILRTEFTDLLTRSGAMISRNHSKLFRVIMDIMVIMVMDTLVIMVMDTLVIMDMDTLVIMTMPIRKPRSFRPLLLSRPLPQL